jgi:general secretion pathway protein D
MELKNLNRNRQKTGKLLKSLFCLTCMFYLNFAGCKSDSMHGTVYPQQEHSSQPTQNLHLEGLTVKQIEQPNEADTNLPEKDKPIASTAFPEPETTKNSSEVLKYESEVPTAHKETILEPIKVELSPTAKVPASNTQVATEKQLPQEGIVNLPILDKPGMANELISVNFDQVDTEKQLPQERTVNLPILDKPGMADELISVNFDQVDIRIMLKTIGDITGINFVVDDSVKGTVTVMSPTKIRLGEIYKVLESILEVKGYAAVPSGDLVKIVPRAEAAKHNLQVRVGSDPAEIPKNDSLVTQIIPLKYASATEVSQIIKPLLATGSHMATYPRTNSILITETSANIHHIAEIIQKLDVTGSKEQVGVIGLTHASAQVLSEQITQIMQQSKGTSSEAGRSNSTPQIETDMKILPDVRTNSLVVVANAQDTKTIERLAKQLDIQRPVGVNNVHVVYLKNAQAKETATSLTGALTNLRIAGALETTQQVQVTADEGTNALIIAASAQDFEVISGIVEKLDIVREQVLVEMLIMEVSEEGLKEIGVDWATLDQAVEGSARGFASTNFGPRVDFVNGDLEGLSVGAWKKSGSKTNIGAIITALEKQTGVNILSTPHIMTSNHHKAKIIVGENVPFVTQSRITETTDLITPTVIKTFEYKDVGISLEIVPHISQGGLVRLEIDSEFTKLVESAVSSDTPTTAKRQAQTVVSMNSGSTIVIGGLIRDDKTTIKKKVPLLGDLPLLGGLFRYDKDELQKTNLLIFITPYVMTGQQDLENITEKKRDEMKPEIEELQKDTADKKNSAGFKDLRGD